MGCNCGCGHSEEKAKAEDMGNYYRVPADNRDLNYEKYLETGSKKITAVEEYTSQNTVRLDVKGTMEILRTVEYIQDELRGKTGLQS